MVYKLETPDIRTIISYCNDMLSDEKLEVYGFGENLDLVLHVYKDEDFNPKESDEYNIITISTFQNGKSVDDTEDLYVTDGSLKRELERINSYKDFATK